MMMTEHVHELRIIRDWTGGIVAKCDVQGCRKTLGIMEVNRLLNANEALRKVIGFFCSVIKSGEPWTDVCQEKYDALFTGGNDETG